MRSTLLVLGLGSAVLVPAAGASQRSAPPPEAAPSAQRGSASADTFTIASRVLGEERRVFVSLPASHGRTARPYPVMVVLDGEFNFGGAVTVAEQLAGLGHAPESIVVGVANLEGGGMRSRVRDLTPPGLSVSGSSRAEGGDAFLDFLQDELLPEIDRRYRGGGPRILVGHSSGGILATWAAATRPALFPVVVALDTPTHLDDGWLADRLVEAAAAPGAADVLRYVTLEVRFGWSDGDWERLRAAAPSGWLLDRRTLDGETHETAPFLGTYLGLRLAFADWSVAARVVTDPALATFERYHRIEESFGVALPPPAPALRTLVEDLLTEGRLDEARAARSWMLDGYGDGPDREHLDAVFARVEPQLPLAETVEDLRNAPWPTAAEMAPWLGEWEGWSGRTPDTADRMAVRLRVVEGAVEGDLVQWPGDGVELVTRLDYLKIVPGGFEFGRMNGMRPRGMIVGTGRVTDGVLEGEERIRGIAWPFAFQPGPPARFRLEQRPPGGP